MNSFIDHAQCLRVVFILLTHTLYKSGLQSSAKINCPRYN